jgi:hypothetical protein
MISLRTRVHVTGIRAQDVCEFMLNPTDERYQAWWPGVHRQFHSLEHRPGYVGDLIYMDEFVGRRRLRMAGRVTTAEPDRRIAWRLEAPLRVPAHLSLDLEDDSSGVIITHTTQAGFVGWGKVLDPVLRLYFSDEFARDLDAHVRNEFSRLAELLSTSATSRAAVA